MRWNLGREKGRKSPPEAGVSGHLDLGANACPTRRSPPIVHQWTPKTSVPIYDFVYDFAFLDAADEA